MKSEEEPEKKVSGIPEHGDALEAEIVFKEVKIRIVTREKIAWFFATAIIVGCAVFVFL